MASSTNDMLRGERHCRPADSLAALSTNIHRRRSTPRFTVRTPAVLIERDTRVSRAERVLNGADDPVDVVAGHARPERKAQQAVTRRECVRQLPHCAAVAPPSRGGV